MPGHASHRHARADRVHLHDQRSRRQHDRAQLRPGRLRARPEGDALSASDPASDAIGATRAVAASYLASFASGDPEAVAAHVSDDFSNVHTSALGSPSQGKATYLERLADFLATFSGLTYQAVDIVVEGDRAAAAYVMRAEVDGTPIEIGGVMRLTIRDGLIERRVDYFDSLTFLRQTGQA
ncbi:MAG: ester cyclase [Acidimicrobiaceae bacterium]|nr:ester cyclase [Acidimicrobiaceae bacterium]